MFVLQALYLISNLHEGLYPTVFQSWCTPLSPPHVLWTFLASFNKKGLCSCYSYLYLYLFIPNNVFIFRKILSIQTFSLIFTQSINHFNSKYITHQWWTIQKHLFIGTWADPWVYISHLCNDSFQAVMRSGFYPPSSLGHESCFCGPPFPFPKCCPSHFMCV